MSATAHSPVTSLTWIEAPWAGAMLRFLGDPAAELDQEAMSSWPSWASLDRALDSATIRGGLGRWLVPDDGKIADLISALATPSARLVLVPSADAQQLVRLLGAWLDAPRIVALIRRNDIAAAREAVGDDAFEFATRRAALLARPGAALMETIDSVAPMPDRFEPQRVMPRGAIALGMAIGAMPSGCAARLRLRRPASVWSIVAEHCRSDPANQDAWTCVRRLIRDRAPAWSTWLN